MKKVGVIIITILILVLLLCTGGYFYGTFYFREWFCPNTYINDIEVSNLDYSYTRSIIESFYSVSDIIVRDVDGEEFVIKAEEVYSFDVNEYDCAVNAILNEENPYYWPYYLFTKHVYKYTPNVIINEKALEDAVNSSFLAQKKRYNPDIVTEIEYSYYDGFTLRDDTKNLLDWDLTLSEIKNAVYTGNSLCDLSTFESYKDVVQGAMIEQTLKDWENIQKFIDFNLTYNLCTGETIEVNSAVVSRFVATSSRGGYEYDENGEIVLDSAKILEFVQDMSDKYDNFYTTQYFDSTRGDKIAINYSRYTTYGAQINIEKEAEILEDLIRNSKDRTLEREPEYLKKMDRGNYQNGYNGTYVEVDLTAQHMYYYKDGKCVLDTDVVTGCQSNGNMTPDCVCFILNKARNVTLIGPGYESFVYYWMCITGQIGIHDATWRSNFGGEIYKYNGSHGCVNTPLKKMGELFDMMEIGTPVFVFR